jgi:opine dehydrogenase
MSEEIKSIAVLGAGHGGFAAAADLTRRGFEVRLQSRNAERLAAVRLRGGIDVEGIHQGFVPLHHLTTRVAEAVQDVDLVMLIVPSVAHAAYARELATVLGSGQPIFLNPGHTGGGLHFVHELREAGFRDEIKIAETVTLTYICRTQSPTAVTIYSYTRNLKLAALPGRNSPAMFALLKPIFPEITLASSVLETGMANINAVFHPPGMLLNAGWIEDTKGDFLFYRDGITPAVGAVAEAVDAERMSIAQALGIPTVPFLETFYQAGLTTAEGRASGSISFACRVSAPNAKVKSPSSLDNRYLHEDVGYGLVPMAEIARLAGVPTPTMDALIRLASETMRIPFTERGLTLEKLGLAGVKPENLVRYVLEGA